VPARGFDVMPDVSVTAFVLITVPARRSGDLVERLSQVDFREVREVAAVYGESDVVAKVETDSISQLHNLVMNRIQSLDNVRVTRTFIVVPDLHVTK
jgi:DNA-binding Lrp family transcriptional regulator